MAEYWIVDLESRIVERWQPDDARPQILDEMLAWTLPGGAAGTIDLKDLFRRVYEDTR